MKKKGLLNKFLSFSIGNWIGIVIGLVSTPIITRILSPEEFGKASMFTLAVNIMLLFSMLGTDQSFTRFFYEESDDGRKKLLLNCLKVSVIVFGAVSLFILFFYKNISEFLFSDSSLSSILILILVVFLQIINRFAVLVIRMEQKGFVFSVLQISLKALDFVGVILFAFLISKDYTATIYSQVLTGIVVTAIAVWFGRNYWKWNVSVHHDSQYSRKDIVTYGMPLAFTLLITWLFQSIDRIAIKQWGEYADLGVYAAAFKIIAIVNILQTTFTTFWVPVSYERYQKNPQDTSFFENMYQLVSIAMFTVAIGTLMCKDILIYLLGNEYRDAAFIMPFLIFMPVMYTISEVTVVGINFAKKPKWHIFISIVACVVNIIGNIILVPHLGAKGAAISTGIAYIVFMYVRTIISMKYFKVNYRLGQFLLATAIVVVYACLGTFDLVNSWENIIVGIVTLLLFLILYRSSIRNIKSMLGNK